jgi:sugar phosphate isomerase/epimerase
LFTGQWADLPLEELAPLAKDMGYGGLELACWEDHFEVDKAIEDEGYVERQREILERYGLSGGRSGEKWRHAAWRAPGRHHDSV